MDADNLTTSAEQPTPQRVTHCPRCTKELNTENCDSWSMATGFHPMPCENCKVPGCDECSDHWAVCVCCGGGICHGCATSARSRSVTDAPAYGAPCRTRTEVLCARCATSQDTALNALATVVIDAGLAWPVPASFTAWQRNTHPDIWLSDIVSDLSDAIRKAKESL